MSVRVVEAQRALSPDEATDLVGSRAADLVPTDALRLRPGEHALHVLDVDTGSTIALLGHLRTSYASALHATLPTMPMSTTLRTGTGYRNRSVVFGYAPRRVATKRESCRESALMRDNETLSDLLRLIAADCGQFMVDNLPGIVEHDRETLRPVLPEWRLDHDDTSLWTSGVINRDSPMPYHRDSNNFPTWSAMPVIRNGVRGGFLHLPEYGLVAPCTDSTVLYWWGQNLVHGVTPLRLMSTRRGDSYRFSLVYYAVRGMKDCATFARETADARARRTARETKMAAEVAVSREAAVIHGGPGQLSPVADNG